jgi:hypothetical protein
MNFRPLQRILLGSHVEISQIVYGSIIVLATLAASAALEHSPWRLAAMVSAEVMVIWVAHVYSDGLHISTHLGGVLHRGELMAIARREAAIPQAAIGPVAALLLGAFGILSEPHSIDLAFGVGLLALAVQGARYARAKQLRGLSTLVPITINLALGLAIVALKAYVSH